MFIKQWPKKKLLIPILLLIALPFGSHTLRLFCLKQTEGFTILGVSSKRVFNPAWQTQPLSKEEEQEVLRAIDQPFTYFGCGGQSFVFFSQDGKYVLKLFKQSKFEAPLYVKYMPIPWVFDRYCSKKLEKKKQKLQRDFTSYKIAFDELKEETGLLYVHLNPTDHLKKILPIVDKLGIAHHLDVDHLDFVLQKKAETVYESIEHLAQDGMADEIREKIGAILHVMQTLSCKGFEDRDPNIRTNCGFLENKAIIIDVGKFKKNDRTKTFDLTLKEIEQVSAPFRTWLETSYPSFLGVFDEELEKLKSTPHA